ncbi:MAG: flavodoxin-dependent (E)-4-hydroxy-3-methylbut-2-enyl-diphosphate synthase [Firmicutes bacterium]|nr:flavodoxin-dependent (E)-4-hydroxy-3-methylbut-2-enyl-diphosphate synthase [Bacillota bacterium]
MDFLRKKTRTVDIGGVKIGGDNPVAIQSMCNTDTRNVPETVNQVKKLEKKGCEIIRVAVPDMEAASALKKIKSQISIPLVADIHFDYKLALASMENGADKIRINPGNIGSAEKVKAVVNMAKDMNIPIRIGVNAGSLEKELLEKYGVSEKSLVQSALKEVSILEKLNFENIVISVKTSSVPMTVKAYSMLSDMTDYPLHIGVTESGTPYNGVIKSSVGIGTLLMMGIGDTIRVSLTGDPLDEIRAAKSILKAAGIRNFGAELISCPTCGRTQIDLISLAEKVEKEIENIDKPIKVAVMGCVVNGPGEAKEADIGICGGKGEGLIIKKGEIIKKLPEKELLSALMEEIKGL